MSYKNLEKLGIRSYVHLVICLVPYMKWTDLATIRKKYYKITGIPETKENKSFYSRYTCLLKKGVFEVQRYHRPGVNVYVSKVRRIVKDSDVKFISKRLYKAKNISIIKDIEEKKRPRENAKLKKVNARNLSYEDWLYIRENKYNINNKKLALMYNVSYEVIKAIRERSYLPVHLRALPSLRYLGDNLEKTSHKPSQR